MRIVESLSDVVAAKPAALEILENIGEVPTYHEIYGVRHPLAAYNTSLASVSQRVRKVIDVLDDVQNRREFDSTSKQDWELPLVEATDHMLDSLMEHMEDCVGIIRSFFPNSKDKGFKCAQKKYNDSVALYREHIGKIVNYLKHNQGRLRIISFSWASGSSLGYFVEGPVLNGGLGPVSIVHPDEASAFSYYRDIPFHLCNIYAVSRRLAVALHEINNDLKPIKKPSNSDKKSDLIMALESASRMPYCYFEDEIEKGVPQIKIGKKSIKIDCPSSKVKAMSVPRGSRISISFRGDGYTRAYKMPYYNAKS